MQRIQSQNHLFTEQRTNILPEERKPMEKKLPRWPWIVAAIAVLFVLQSVQQARYRSQVEHFPDDSIIGNGRPVLLQISSAYCIYCRRMLPTLTELAHEYTDRFTVAVVSLDKQPQAKQKYEVQAVPVQIFYDGQGQELFRHTGKMSRDEILDCWRRLGIEIP